MEARTIREAIDAFQANFPDFMHEFSKDQRAYNILVDDDTTDIEQCYVPIHTSSTVDILPLIAGAGLDLKLLGTVIVGAILIVATSGAGAAFVAGGLGGSLGTGFAAGSVLGAGGLGGALAIGGAFAAGYVGAVAVAAIGWGLVLAGVASLLAGPDGPKAGDGSGSTSFSGLDNIIGQGMPVPIGYGRLGIGSFVLSSTYMSSLSQVSKATSVDGGASTVDYQMNIGGYVERIPGEDEIPQANQGLTDQEYSATAAEITAAQGTGTWVVSTVVINGVNTPVTEFKAGGASINTSVSRKLL
jgi:predicted phage tail protein